MTSANTGAGHHGALEAPDLCRITVLAQHTEVDLALPLGVPVALLLPGIVDLVASHRSDNRFDSTPERVEPGTWTLARIGHAPLSGALSLDEHGIRDGELLVLADVGSPAPPPLFDDVMYAVAVAGKDGFRRWGAAPASALATVLAPVSLAAGCFSLFHLPDGPQRLAAGATAAVMCVLFLLAATVLSRSHDDQRTALVPALCAVPVAFTAGSLVVPGDFGAPHLLLGTVLVGAVAVVALRTARVGVATFTGVAATAVGAAATLLLASTTGVDLHALGAGAVVTALLLAGTAPRLAAVFGRLPVPPVPVPGTSLDPVAPDPETANPLPSFDELDDRIMSARAYLRGLVYAVVVLGAGGAWCAAYPIDGAVSWPGVALAVVTALVLMFRGRSYTASTEAVPLVAGGAVILLVLIIGAVVLTPITPWLVSGAALMLMAGTIVFGSAAPRRQFTPVQRRIAELTEYTVIAMIVPLVCWVAGLYSAARGL